MSLDPERSPSDPSPPRAGAPLSAEEQAAMEEARDAWRKGRYGLSAPEVTAFEMGFIAILNRARPQEQAKLDHQSQEEAKYEGLDTEGRLGAEVGLLRRRVRTLEGLESD